MKLIHVPESEHNHGVSRKKANAILKLRPDVIFFEYPSCRKNSLSTFNKFEPAGKPREKIDEWKASIRNAAEQYPWLREENRIIEAVEYLWKKGRQVYLFEIDGPENLTNIGETAGPFNIAWNYLREIYMKRNLRRGERKKPKGTGLVLCHDFHWKNIQFLMKNPNQKQIWDHYFVRNGITTTPKEFENELKKENKMLYKYWKLKT